MVTDELLKEQEYELARDFIKRLTLKKFINKEAVERTLESVKKTQLAQQKLLDHLQKRSLAFSQQ